jgi:hypothetical protein
MLMGFMPFSLMPLWELISHKSEKLYPYLLMSLPRKIGRIISADFASSLISLSFVIPSMINALL